MTLAHFITARLAEQRIVAAESQRDPWRVGHTESCNWWGDMPGYCSCDATARALADVAAKRRIVDAFEDERQRMDIYNRDYPLGLLTTEGDLRARLSSNARWAGLEIAMRALASVWSDHPDYRDEWKP